MNEFSNILDVVKKIDFIAFSALALAGRTFYVQQFGVEVIVYPYQEKHGDYGIAIENIGKGTAIDYTFKVLSYDENTEPETKNFLDTYKLLNGEARITLAGGKIHKIKIGHQGDIPYKNMNRREEEEDFPTIEIQILKRNHDRNYKIITRSTICDLKAFEGYPYTEEPLELIRRDMNHQALMSMGSGSSR
ncbi:hypothetical protein [Exiguobacterium undae]|uniref:Uncharacterized protein n=1 Tax=Exiguobacterium undae TaxID=169177 RepID=A0ABX2V8T0_9BACL|nr:hypothetical protein [Exiguobacterium undae]OAN13871.1 hypothetical protein A3783_16375 [Exiguobacterium undae]